MSDRRPEVYNPVTGVRLRVLVTPEESSGRLLVLEVTFPPHSPEPPDHLHPIQSERFEVISGSLSLRRAGRLEIVGAGSEFDIPAGMRHAMWNHTHEEARLLWTTNPALRTLDFFRKLATLAAEGRTGPTGVPHLLQAAVLMNAYRDEIRVTRPPAPIQRVLFAILAPLGRVLGYSAR
jgi:quercetin dioxygenase-like cupin family protein